MIVLPFYYFKYGLRDFSLQTALLLDLSSSVTNQFLSELRNAVSRFINVVALEQNYIGIYGFAGGEELIEIQTFTLNKDLLLNSLESIGEQIDKSTNLFGGIIYGIDELNDRISNPPSIFREGLMVVFTDGRDRAGYFTEDEAIDAIRQSDATAYGISVGGEIDPEQQTVC